MTAFASLFWDFFPIFSSFIKLSLSEPTSFLVFALTILSPVEIIILMSGWTLSTLCCDCYALNTSNSCNYILGDSEEVLALCVCMKLKLNCSHSEMAAFVSTSFCLLEEFLLLFPNSKTTCRSKAPHRSWEMVTTVLQQSIGELNG